MYGTPQKTVILSEAPSRSIAQRRVYSAQSKDPGDACWQILLKAFRPQSSIELKKVTASELSAAQIYRTKKGLQRGVEEPVLSEAEGTPAMPVGSSSSKLSGHEL